MCAERRGEVETDAGFAAPATEEGKGSAFAPRGGSGSSLQHGPLQRLGYLDSHEAAGGVQIVFTALVDDSKIALLGGIRVGNDGVDFMQFQGRLVLGVVDADDKPRS